MSMSRRLLLAAALVAPLVAACSDSTAPEGDPVAGKALVLMTYGAPGVSIVGDTGTAVDHIGFGDLFDGATFTVRGDTVLTTSSKFGGDLLFVSDVGAGTFLTVPLPVGSNPAGVIPVPASVPGGSGAPRYAVALRDSSAVAIVTRGSGAPTITMLRGAGECPYDVIASGEALFSLDANENCRDFYQILGPVRLIRLAIGAIAGDTLTLGDGVRGSARALTLGNGRVLVVASGNYFDRPGRIAEVTISAGVAAASRELSLPAGYYATAASLGRDGDLYVTASGGEVYAPRVFRIDPDGLAFTGPYFTNAEPFLELRDDEGDFVRCDAATADADGSVYCASNGNLSARLLVFSPTLVLQREVPLDGIAADIVVR